MNVYGHSPSIMSMTGAPKRTVVRRPFTPDEDVRLMEIMRVFPFTSWEAVAHQMGDRTSRQVRERWVNYLSPNIRCEPWTEAEDQLLLDKINELGRCWSTIGHFFNGRSENDVKNRWYSHLRYRTAEDGYGRLQFVDPSESAYPERKKRNRPKISPKQNALRMMEQQRRVVARPHCQPVVVPLLRVNVEPVPPIVRAVAQPQEQQVADVVPRSIVDSWDLSLFDDMVLEKFDVDDIPDSLGFFEH